MLFGIPGEDLDFGSRKVIATPHWWYKIFVNELPCGCARRKLTNRKVLICWTHVKEQLGIRGDDKK